MQERKLYEIASSFGQVFFSFFVANFEMCVCVCGML